MIDSIFVPIYNRDVAILSDITVEEFDRFYYDNVLRISDEEYKSLRKDILGDSFDGTTCSLDLGNILMWCREGNIDRIVSHEIFHVCHTILSEAGIELTEDGEAYAYLIGWFTDAYYKKYWQWKESKEEENKKKELEEKENQKKDKIKKKKQVKTK